MTPPEEILVEKNRLRKFIGLKFGCTAGVCPTCRQSRERPPRRDFHSPPRLRELSPRVALSSLT